MSADMLSVVVPLYNRGHTIGRTMASLLDAHSPDMEIIVVDDGSHDDGPEIVMAMQAEMPCEGNIQLLRQPNSGPGAARNLGAQHARGDWVAFLDSDDFWMPWTPKVIADTLQVRPDVRVMLLRTAMFENESDLDGVSREKTDIRWSDTVLDMRTSPDRLKQYGSCNLVMHRQTFLALGGFTDETLCGEDIDLLCRAGDLGAVASIASPILVAFRNGGADSLGRNMAAVYKGVCFLLKREMTGHYSAGGPKAKRRQALSDSIVFTINRFFRTGHPILAYRLYAQALPFLISARRGVSVLKLGLTPILSILRPQHYQFRIFPIGTEGREPGFDVVNNG